MTMADPYDAIRRVLIDESSVANLLLPQDALPGLAVPPIFAGEFPRKTAQQPHDYAALLSQRSIKLLLVSPTGRAPSGGDTSRALWHRPRFDLLSYGPTFHEAMTVHLAAEAELKDLFRRRASLTGGYALVHDVAIEGGPISFVDPDTDCPVVVGIYAASVAEEFVSVA